MPMYSMELQQIRTCIQESGMTRKDIVAALERFGKKRVLLVGDPIIDVYTQCSAIGKTAKTPTLSVKKGTSNYYWGGASLIANNLFEMGGTVTFVAVMGNDWGYDFFSKKSHERMTNKFFKDETRPTTVKERYWVDGYKLLQVDVVENHDIPKELEDEVYRFLETMAGSYDFIFIADNRHGIMTPGLIQRCKQLSRANNIPLVVDTQVSSRWGNLEEYCGVSMICVNEHESRFFLRDEKVPIAEIRKRLVDLLKPERLLIKLKDKGMMGWDHQAGDFSFPAFPVKVVDAIGAGDSFLSAAGLSFDPQTKLMASIYLASCAGAIAVKKLGTDPTTFDEIRSFALEHLDLLEIY